MIIEHIFLNSLQQLNQYIQDNEINREDIIQINYQNLKYSIIYCTNKNIPKSESQVTFKIILNGEQRLWHKNTITYREVVELSWGSEKYSDYYSITWRTPMNNGILTHSDKLHLGKSKETIIINCYLTGNA